jgi:hypothetical protein
MKISKKLESTVTRKLFLKVKAKNHIRSKKLISKIFYNLTYAYIKNNFSLINKLIKFSSFSNVLLMNHYNLIDNIMYNDLFILNYLDNNLNNKMKTMININKNKKPLSIITILKRIIFSNKKFFRLIKNEKSFLKINIYNIYFFLFYYYMTNSLHYVSFLKFNNLKKKNSLFTLNIFLKKNLKRSFKFFFKNIIMFLYKFSLIKTKKKKLFKTLLRKQKRIHKIINYKNIYYFKKKKIRFFFRKRIILPYRPGIINRKKYFPFSENIKMNYKNYNKNNIFFKKRKDIVNYKLPNLKKRIQRLKRNKKREKRNRYKLKKNEKLKNEKLKNKNKKKNKLKINIFKKKIFIKRKLKLKKKSKSKFKIKKFFKDIKKKKFKIYIKKLFKTSLTKFKKKNSIFFFKRLFFKKTLVKRIAELSFKKDSKLKNAAAILKNNKKFKFLTFPVNSICKFFFKNSMYNIFMTLIVLPLNLTIGNYSGGHFNILSKRRDRGSINSLKSMAKLISLKIYQSNLSFIIFCPRLFTNNNKRLIKTIFYSFKILNRSPITKIYLYRPVIRNGIRAKKIPRK